MMETTQTAHVLSLEKHFPVSARQSPESRAEQNMKLNLETNSESKPQIKPTYIKEAF